MEVNVTFRHSDPSPVLKENIERKLEKVAKYFMKATQVHVILNVEKSRHIAEITLSENHRTLYAREDSHDMYRSLDGAILKIEKQLKKLKEKTKRHHGRI